MESTPFFPSPRSRRRRRYSEPSQHWHATAATGWPPHWPEPAPLLARRYPTPALHTTGADAPAATGWQEPAPVLARGAGDRRTWGRARGINAHQLRNLMHRTCRSRFNQAERRVYPNKISQNAILMLSRAGILESPGRQGRWNRPAPFCSRQFGIAKSRRGPKRYAIPPSFCDKT